MIPNGIGADGGRSKVLEGYDLVSLFKRAYGVSPCLHKDKCILNLCG